MATKPSGNRHQETDSPEPDEHTALIEEGQETDMAATVPLQSRDSDGDLLHGEIFVSLLHQTNVKDRIFVKLVLFCICEIRTSFAMFVRAFCNLYTRISLIGRRSIKKLLHWGTCTFCTWYNIPTTAEAIASDTHIFLPVRLVPRWLPSPDPMGIRKVNDTEIQIITEQEAGNNLPQLPVPMFVGSLFVLGCILVVAVLFFVGRTSDVDGPKDLKQTAPAVPKKPEPVARYTCVCYEFQRR